MDYKHDTAQGWFATVSVCYTSPDTFKVVTVVCVFCLVEGHVHLIHQEHMELAEEFLELISVSEGLSPQPLLPYDLHQSTEKHTQTHKQ